MPYKIHTDMDFLAQPHARACIFECWPYPPDV